MNKRITTSFRKLFDELTDEERKRVEESIEDYDLIDCPVVSELTHDQRKRRDRARDRAKALMIKMILSRLDGNEIPESLQRNGAGKIRRTHEVHEERLTKLYRPGMAYRTPCNNTICMCNYNGACGHAKCITGHRIIPA